MKVCELKAETHIVKKKHKILLSVHVAAARNNHEWTQPVNHMQQPFMHLSSNNEQHTDALCSTLSA